LRVTRRLATYIHHLCKVTLQSDDGHRCGPASSAGLENCKGDRQTIS
jgi:hypothetical protein